MRLKRQVVMLPTNEKASDSLLWLMHNKSQGLMYLHNATGLDGQGYHLYFLSDEKIQGNDWCLYGKKIVKCQSDRAGIIWTQQPNIYKKIIATTDSALFVTKKTGTEFPKEYLEKMPKLSNAFVQKYVSEYNKGNIITEVMVEYEQYDANPRAADWKEQYVKYMLEHKENLQWRLKVDKDGYITTYKLKDSWNREELLQLIDRLYSQGGFDDYLNELLDKNNVIKEVSFSESAAGKKWIEQNL